MSEYNDSMVNTPAADEDFVVETTASVVTAVRIRPDSSQEIRGQHRSITSVEGGQSAEEMALNVLDPTFFHRKREYEQRYFERQFKYDFCFWQDSTQQAVYESVGRPLLQHALDGFNCCILAYGQTGSGKTFTMIGDETQDVWGNDVEFGVLAATESAGIAPRLCKGLLEAVKLSMAGPHALHAGGSTSNKEDGKEKEKENSYQLIQANIQASFYEIYNEKVFDLLVKNKDTHHSRVREHPEDGAYVESLTMCPIETLAHAAEVMSSGLKQRVVAETRMNAMSSRSHAVFTLHLKQKLCNRNIKKPVQPQFKAAGKGQKADSNVIQRSSKITLVDLAGSERVSLTGASGERLTEANNINKSLSTLSDVIKVLSDKGYALTKEKESGSVNASIDSTSLSKGGKDGNNFCFVPYRNSVLTWLLKDCLGGNARTSMLANVGPSEHSYNETMSTLRYVERAKLIVNSARINETSTDPAFVLHLQKQVAALRVKIVDLRKENAKREDEHRKELGEQEEELENQFTSRIVEIRDELFFYKNRSSDAGPGSPARGPSPEKAVLSNPEAILLRTELSQAHSLNEQQKAIIATYESSEGIGEMQVNNGLQSPTAPTAGAPNRMKNIVLSYKREKELMAHQYEEILNKCRTLTHDLDNSRDHIDRMELQKSGISADLHLARADRNRLKSEIANKIEEVSTKMSELDYYKARLSGNSAEHKRKVAFLEMHISKAKDSESNIRHERETDMDKFTEILAEKTKLVDTCDERIAEAESKLRSQVEEVKAKLTQTTKERDRMRQQISGKIEEIQLIQLEKTQLHDDLSALKIKEQQLEVAQKELEESRANVNRKKGKINELQKEFDEHKTLLVSEQKKLTEAFLLLGNTKNIKLELEKKVDSLQSDKVSLQSQLEELEAKRGKQYMDLQSAHDLSMKKAAQEISTANENLRMRLEELKRLENELQTWKELELKKEQDLDVVQKHERKQQNELEALSRDIESEKKLKQDLESRLTAKEDLIKEIKTALEDANSLLETEKAAGAVLTTELEATKADLKLNMENEIKMMAVIQDIRSNKKDLTSQLEEKSEALTVETAALVSQKDATLAVEEEVANLKQSLSALEVKLERAHHSEKELSKDIQRMESLLSNDEAEIESSKAKYFEDIKLAEAKLEETQRQYDEGMARHSQTLKSAEEKSAKDSEKKTALLKATEEKNAELAANYDESVKKAELQLESMRIKHDHDVSERLKNALQSHGQRIQEAKEKHLDEINKNTEKMREQQAKYEQLVRDAAKKASKQDMEHKESLAKLAQEHDRVLMLAKKLHAEKEKEFKEAYAVLQEQLHSTGEGDKKALAEMHDKLNEANIATHEQRAEYSQAAEKLARLEFEYAEFQKKFYNIEQENDKLQVLVQENDSVVKLLVSTHEQEKHELEGLRKRIANFEHEQGIMGGSPDVVVGLLRDEVSEAEERIEQLEQEKADLEQEVQSQTSFAPSAAPGISLEAELVLRGELNDSRTTLLERDSTIHELQKQVGDLTTTIAAAKQAIPSPSKVKTEEGTPVKKKRSSIFKGAKKGWSVLRNIAGVEESSPPTKAGDGETGGRHAAAPLSADVEDLQLQLQELQEQLEEREGDLRNERERARNGQAGSEHEDTPSTGKYYSAMKAKQNEWKPVHSMIRWENPSNLSKFAKMLAISPKILSFRDPRSQNVPLHISAQNGHEKSTEMILGSTDGRSTINFQNCTGQTALHMAVAYDYYSIVQMLIKAGADSNKLNDDGFSAISGIDGTKTLGLVAFAAAETGPEIIDSLERITSELTKTDKGEYAKVGLKVKRESGVWSNKINVKFMEIFHRLSDVPPQTPQVADKTTPEMLELKAELLALEVKAQGKEDALQARIAELVADLAGANEERDKLLESANAPEAAPMNMDDGFSASPTDHDPFSASASIPASTPNDGFGDPSTTDDDPFASSVSMSSPMDDPFSSSAPLDDAFSSSAPMADSFSSSAPMDDAFSSSNATEAMDAFDGSSNIDSNNDGFGALSTTDADLQKKVNEAHVREEELKAELLLLNEQLQSFRESEVNARSEEAAAKEVERNEKADEAHVREEELKAELLALEVKAQGKEDALQARIAELVADLAGANEERDKLLESANAPEAAPMNMDDGFSASPTDHDPFSASASIPASTPNDGFGDPSTTDDDPFASSVSMSSPMDDPFSSSAPLDDAFSSSAPMADSFSSSAPMDDAFSSSNATEAMDAFDGSSNIDSNNDGFGAGDARVRESALEAKVLSLSQQLQSFRESEVNARSEEDAMREVERNEIQIALQDAQTREGELKIEIIALNEQIQSLKEVQTKAYDSTDSGVDIAMNAEEYRQTQEQLSQAQVREKELSAEVKSLNTKIEDILEAAKAGVSKQIDAESENKRLSKEIKRLQMKIKSKAPMKLTGGSDLKSADVDDDADDGFTMYTYTEDALREELILAKMELAQTQAELEQSHMDLKNDEEDIAELQGVVLSLRNAIEGKR